MSDWRDSYDAWKLREPDYQQTEEEADEEAHWDSPSRMHEWRKRMGYDFKYADGVPTALGFYWAKWRLADDGTFEGPGYTDADRDGVMSDRYEVVELVENCIDHSDDDWLRVSVGGVDKSQHPENFIWGPRIADFNG